MLLGGESAIHRVIEHESEEETDVIAKIRPK